MVINLLELQRNLGWKDAESTEGIAQSSVYTVNYFQKVSICIIYYIFKA